jgi:4-diphosphocytidyl-2-C-methyl-D-erythritol kinase
VKLKVRCPAKINPFLAVGPAEPTGYHPLRTVFQAISLSDWLWVSDEPIEDEQNVRFRDRNVVFSSNWPDLPEANTVSRAIRLLREYGDLDPVFIHLEKVIPHEAGLGGGSSDAAGFLRIANRIAPASFSREQLFDVAVAVGADVPFFLVGGRAKAEGYGERLTPLDDLPTQHLVVLKPDVSCATGEAYRRLDERPYPFRDFPENEELYNDFERVMPCECDDWSEHLQLLGARGALLCGSGSAVFGVFDDEAAVERALDDLQARRGIRAWKARTLTRAESLAVEAT